jgi:hypothetical protein
MDRIRYGFEFGVVTLPSINRSMDLSKTGPINNYYPHRAITTIHTRAQNN